MKDQPSSKKPLIILAVIVIIAIIIYFAMSGKPNDTSTSSVSTETAADGTTVEASDAQVRGAGVLVLLNQINSLKVDGSIFESPAFKSLIDYTILIPERTVGRSNPFAP